MAYYCILSFNSWKGTPQTTKTIRKVLNKVLYRNKTLLVRLCIGQIRIRGAKWLGFYFEHTQCKRFHFKGARNGNILWSFSLHISITAHYVSVESTPHALYKTLIYSFVFPWTAKPLTLIRSSPSVVKSSGYNICVKVSPTDDGRNAVEFSGPKTVAYPESTQREMCII